MSVEYDYLELLRDILENGIAKGDRTGTGTFAVFGRTLRHDLSLGLPLLTTKKLHFKSIVHELLWFLRGEENTKFLQENKVTIWDEWATKEGSLGPIYGVQWRKWRGADGNIYDQVTNLVDSLRNNPNSRRHIISAWNVADLPNEKLSPQENVASGKMALAPCHVLYQFWVGNGNLSCMMTQRSGDCFLGIPYNLASVSILTMMLAQQANLIPGEIIHNIGDCHLYVNHLEQAKLQISRPIKSLPKLTINPAVKSIFDYQYQDFTLGDYQPHPHIPAPIAI